MARTATGKYAKGICDRCGFTYRLSELHEEYVQGRPTGMRVCPTDFDPDHPQNFLGKLNNVADAQALKDPRPDTGLGASREIPD